MIDCKNYFPLIIKRAIYILLFCYFLIWYFNTSTSCKNNKKNHEETWHSWISSHEATPSDVSKGPASWSASWWFCEGGQRLIALLDQRQFSSQVQGVLNRIEEAILREALSLWKDEGSGAIGSHPEVLSLRLRTLASPWTSCGSPQRHPRVGHLSPNSSPYPLTLGSSAPWCVCSSPMDFSKNPFTSLASHWLNALWLYI